MNRDAKDGVPVPIRQGLVNLYKLDKSYKHIAAEIDKASIGMISLPKGSILVALYTPSLLHVHFCLHSYILCG